MENVISEVKLYYPSLIGGCGFDSENVIPPVFCMIVYQLTTACDTILYSTKSTSMLHIASVLDWEELCYVDPRFVLLVLCQKVVANQIQANIIQ